MQALGSYEGGRMLFLGLGTGLGTALVVDNVVAPLELAHLPYRKKQTYEDYLGERGWTGWGGSLAEVRQGRGRALSGRPSSWITSFSAAATRRSC